MGIIYHVDFANKKVDKAEKVEEKEKKLDPVLQYVKERMPKEHFEMYKRTIDHWMQANFEYEMRKRNEEASI